MQPVVPTLNEEEKVRIRHHLLYPQVRAIATFALGTPANIQTDFIIENAMNQVMPAALPTLRQYIQVLDCIECSMIDGMEVYDLAAIDNIQINGLSQRQKQALYDRWIEKLEMFFGVPMNPMRYYTRGGRGSRLNARVSG